VDLPAPTLPNCTSPEPVSALAPVETTAAVVAGVEMDSPPPEAVYLSPPDTERRFPVFTSPQIALIIDWTFAVDRRRGDCVAALEAAGARRAALPAYPNERQGVAANSGYSSHPAPAPTEAVTADQLLEEAVRATLTAYNPFGVTRLPLSDCRWGSHHRGEAEHQPEKEGAGNVLRLVSGVKRVVNRLSVKTEPGTPPLRIDDGEARALEVALRRHLAAQEPSPSASLDPGSSPVPESAVATVEAEREAGAAAPRAGVPSDSEPMNPARRQAAEERLRREAEEAARREQELEAARQRPAQSRQTGRRSPAGQAPSPGAVWSTELMTSSFAAY
jgi:hypothetical protein